MNGIGIVALCRMSLLSTTCLHRVPILVPEILQIVFQNELKSPFIALMFALVWLVQVPMIMLLDNPPSSRPQQ